MSALPLPVQSYLEQFEIALKAQPTESVEDALCDAREHLLRDWQALTQVDPQIAHADIVAHFHTTFGPPEQAAENFRIADPITMRKGNAPGWRICCRNCGRSVPAEMVGVIRIGAYSNYKLTLTWCRGCNRWRWVRFMKDMDTNNITSIMGIDKSPDAIRQELHRFQIHWLLYAAILALLILAILALTSFRFLGATEPDPPELKISSPWKLVSEHVIRTDQAKLIGKRLNAELVQLKNTIVAFNGASIQVNTLVCKSEVDAQAAYQSLNRIKQGKQLLGRNGLTVFEIVSKEPKNARIALKAKYDLGIQPFHVEYDVAFDAAPLSRASGMDWNPLFNRYLSWDGKDPDGLREIDKLQSKFEFASELRLRQFGVGETATRWILEPDGRGRQDPISQVMVFPMQDSHRRAGKAFAKVRGHVTSHTSQTTPYSGAPDRWLVPTPQWPSDSPSIQQISDSLTKGVSTPREKVLRILDWFSESGKMRFGGDQKGSRYGTEKTLGQGYGHCWDFADLMVSLCRAAKVPARQVFGWLDGSEGHVWVEVIIDQGWWQVDPTAGLACGSDYIPIAVSDDGEPPLIYMSIVEVKK